MHYLSSFGIELLRGRMNLYRLILLLCFIPLAYGDIDPIINSELEIYGKNFSKQLNSSVSIWVTGKMRFPDCLENLPGHLNSIVMNTPAPGETNYNDLIKNNPSLHKNPDLFFNISSQNFEIRRLFKDRYYNWIALKKFVDVYNHIVIRSRDINCWNQKKSSLRNTECDSLNYLALGLLATLYDNQKILSLEPIKTKPIILALTGFLTGAHISSEEIIGIYLFKYQFEPDSNHLWNLSYKMNELTKLYKDVNSGELNLLQGQLDGAENGAKRNILINHFVLAHNILESSENSNVRSQDFQWRVIAQIESLKDYLKKISSLKESGFSAEELYSRLGLLHKYYSSNGQFNRLDQLKVFRSWLRAESEELTTSKLERSFLKVWGLLTNFGTSTAVLSKVMIYYLSLVFLTLIFSSSKTDFYEWLLEVIQNFLKVITVKADGVKVFGSSWPILFYEMFSLLFIPTYLGFMITFLLRYE